MRTALIAMSLAATTFAGGRDGMRQEPLDALTAREKRRIYDAVQGAAMLLIQDKKADRPRFYNRHTLRAAWKDYDDELAKPDVHPMALYQKRIRMVLNALVHD